MSLLDEAHRLDDADHLASLREQFHLPEGVAYLDGNSLGALPKATPDRIARTVQEEWGEGLIRSWNPVESGGADWIGAPTRVGNAIAPLIGAREGEVIACDSVSVNLFKLIGAALQMRPGRTVVLSEPGNFPTDLYMIEGLERQGLAEQSLVQRDAMEEALDEDVALLLLTHVHYKSGAMFDMARLTRAAHDAGALVLWDLSHSAGAVELDLTGCQADFAVGCGYKYLNGGPGAPGFAYAAQRHHAEIAQPLSGWMGHARPFAFSDDYEPAPGIERLLAGTPPILGLAALEEGVRVMGGAGMAALAAKSRSLSEFMRGAMASHVPELACVSPADPLHRGSQLSFRHDHAFELCQALIARGVVGDFRDPDILRFGFAPAYVTHADCARAVTDLRAILDSGEWREDRFAQRSRVT